MTTPDGNVLGASLEKGALVCKGEPSHKGFNGKDFMQLMGVICTEGPPARSLSFNQMYYAIGLYLKIAVAFAIKLSM
eukprot:5580955-Amphidinium_carterae.1